MDCTLSDLQQEVRKSYERFFEKESTPDRVRAAEPLGFDRALWDRIAATGVVGMSVAEEHGGGGAGAIELALVAEEYGRRLAPIPLVEAVVAGRLLSRFEAARSADWYGPVLAGEQIAILAPRPAAAGRWPLAPAGAVADLLVGLDGNRLLACPVAGDAPRSSPENLGSLPLADCVPGPDALVLAEGDEARAAFQAAVAEWKVLTAAALTGLAEQAIALALEYVKVRKAFGITIGSFQTVVHRLADDRVRADGSHLLCLEAAWAIDQGLGSAARFSAMAFADATQTAGKAAGDSLHLHGGLGFTMEGDIQLYLRRAKAWPLVLGDPRQELRRLGDLVIEAASEEAHDGIPA
jgi:alkylation response protein AidB-like acyl-CoA dehydrogenase